jgi:rubredoxin
MLSGAGWSSEVRNMQEKVCVECGLIYDNDVGGKREDDTEDFECLRSGDNGLCPICQAESEETAVFEVEKELLW